MHNKEGKWFGIHKILKGEQLWHHFIKNNISLEMFRIFYFFFLLSYNIAAVVIIIIVITFPPQQPYTFTQRSIDGKRKKWVRESERKMACRWWLKGSVCTTAAEKHPSMIFCLNHNFFSSSSSFFLSLFLFPHFHLELALLTFENHFFSFDWRQR